MYIGAIIIYRIFIHLSFCMEDTSKLLYMPWHKLNGITHYSQHFAVQRGRYTIGRLNLALVYIYQFIMMTSSNGNIFRVTGHLCGEFLAQRPVTRSFDVFFDLRLNKRLRKQWQGWSFETPSSPVWHCDVWRMTAYEIYWQWAPWSQLGDVVTIGANVNLSFPISPLFKFNNYLVRYQCVIAEDISESKWLYFTLWPYRTCISVYTNKLIVKSHGIKS